MGYQQTRSSHMRQLYTKTYSTSLLRVIADLNDTTKYSTFSNRVIDTRRVPAGIHLSVRNAKREDQIEGLSIKHSNIDIRHGQAQSPGVVK